MSPFPSPCWCSDSVVEKDSWFIKSGHLILSVYSVCAPMTKTSWSPSQNPLPKLKINFKNNGSLPRKHRNWGARHTAPTQPRRISGRLAATQDISPHSATQDLSPVPAKQPLRQVTASSKILRPVVVKHKDTAASVVEITNKRVGIW